MFFFYGFGIFFNFSACGKSCRVESALLTGCCRVEKGGASLMEFVLWFFFSFFQPKHRLQPKKTAQPRAAAQPLAGARFGHGAADKFRFGTFFPLVCLGLEGDSFVVFWAA